MIAVLGDAVLGEIMLIIIRMSESVGGERRQAPFGFILIIKFPGNGGKVTVCVAFSHERNSWAHQLWMSEVRKKQNNARWCIARLFISRQGSSSWLESKAFPWIINTSKRGRKRWNFTAKPVSVTRLFYCKQQKGVKFCHICRYFSMESALFKHKVPHLCEANTDARIPKQCSKTAFLVTFSLVRTAAERTHQQMCYNASKSGSLRNLDVLLGGTHPNSNGRGRMANKRNLVETELCGVTG